MLLVFMAAPVAEDLGWEKNDLTSGLVIFWLVLPNRKNGFGW